MFQAVLSNFKGGLCILHLGAAGDRNKDTGQIHC